jgi:hypothetical protein
MSTEGPYGRRGYDANAGGYGGGSYSSGPGSGGYAGYGGSQAPGYGGASYAYNAPPAGGYGGQQYGQGAPIDAYQVGYSIATVLQLAVTRTGERLCLSCSMYNARCLWSTY